MGSYVIDWLEVTVPCGDSLQLRVNDLLALFGGGELLERGQYGYDCGYSILGSGRLLWCTTRSDMGVHVILPASALARCSLKVVTLCAVLLDRDGHATRLDVAVDSGGPDGGGVALDLVWEGIRCGLLVSHARRVGVIQQFTREDVGLGYDGRTIYIGSSRSDCLVRFYDKASEQGLDPECVTWSRCEVQFRRSRADVVFRALVDEIDPRGFILSVVDFRFGDDKCVTRRDRAEWWCEWLCCGERVRFPCVARCVEIDRIRAWVEKQVSQGLAMVVAADGGCMEWLYMVLAKGWGDCPLWKRDIVAASKGLDREELEGMQ